MTSTSNLVIFKPKYLYIKQHSVTGLMYFGTTHRNPIKYLGSGKYWLRHINKHGKEHVVTLWHELFTNKDELVQFATQFSKDLNIVKSKSWANLKDENGLDGGVYGYRHSKETIDKLKGRIVSFETREKLRQINIGKSHSTETKLKCATFIGRTHTKETKHKQRLAKIGKSRDKSTIDAWKLTTNEKKEKFTFFRTDGLILENYTLCNFKEYLKLEWLPELKYTSESSGTYRGRLGRGSWTFISRP